MDWDADKKQVGQQSRVFWIGSSRKDLREFPKDVRVLFGQALFDAQCGGKHPDAKPLKGFGGGVLEVVGQFEGDAYRAVYTVRFRGALYVLHAFQKKSKSGIATPPREIEVIRQRLQSAKEDYAKRFRDSPSSG